MPTCHPTACSAALVRMYRTQQEGAAYLLLHKVAVLAAPGRPVAQQQPRLGERGRARARRPLPLVLARALAAAAAATPAAGELIFFVLLLHRGLSPLPVPCTGCPALVRSASRSRDPCLLRWQRRRSTKPYLGRHRQTCHQRQAAWHHTAFFTAGARG